MFGFMVNIEPCDLHELTNCALCNGDLKAQEASLMDVVEYEPGTLLAPGIIAAQFPGHCADCGQNFGRGSPIRASEPGRWIAIACCG